MEEVGDGDTLGENLEVLRLLKPLWIISSISKNVLKRLLLTLR